MTDGENLDTRQAEEIRRKKRFFWTQEGAGAEYQYSAYKTGPLARLKNIVEIGFVSRHLRGPLILDAGAGTGRFSLPLEQQGHTLIPLDISAEMLAQGVARAGKSGLRFPAMIGDVERLPFRDGTLDSVVSITVLRHFPDWERIFAECVRVLRPGGRLVFDMASGDQRAFLAANGHEVSAPQDPQGYNAALSVRHLEALCAQHGLSIVTTAPNDFLSENAVLDHVLRGAKPAFMRRLDELLSSEEALLFCELVCRRLLPALSPALSGSWLIALEKGGTDSSRAFAFRQAAERSHPEEPEERLWSILDACVGRPLPGYLRELARFAATPEAQDFILFCREGLLSRYPLDTLWWEAGE